MRLAIRLSTLALFVLAFPGTSLAGKNANGAMIVHTNDAVNYTVTGANFCEDSYNPVDCISAVTQSNKGPDDEAMIWFLASFYEGTNPAVAGVQFGVRHNLPPGQGYVPHWHQCPPDALVLPDEGFPDVPGGTLIGFLAPVYDRLLTFAWFGVYQAGPGSFFGSGVYPGDGLAKFADDSVPPVEDLCHSFGEVHWMEPGSNDCPVVVEGACCYPDGSCEVLLEEQCTGVWVEGVTCDPNPCEQPQACCFVDGSCQELLQADCDAQGGVPMGQGTNCDPSPCGPPYRACCLPNGQCEVVTVAECEAAGGVFVWDAFGCEPFPCSEACCFSDGSCLMLMQEECAAEGGQAMGDGTVCDDVECIPVATEPTTWGKIKARYR
ncbi:MAG: hypothetical protein ACE15D_03540 [Candidatus Eisenbacteria bacterium]|nr:hypothetical protein [Candidatus Eisenbacteria bacterium]